MDAVAIQYVFYFIGGFFSIILLVVIFIQQFSINKNDIIKNCLIIIVISEIINSIHKLINFLKNDNNKETICKIQKGIGTFSDICTPFLSLIIARELYCLTKNNEFSSFGLSSSYIIYIIGLFIPLIITIIFYLIDYNLLSNSIKININYPCNINEPLLFYLYGVFWIFIILSLYFSISTLIIINQKKEEFLLLEKELLSDSEDEIKKDNLAISPKLNKMYKNNLKYPITIILIWFIVTIIRVIHYIVNKDKNNIEMLKRIFILYAFINSFRGTIYCFVFFTKNDCIKNKKEKKNSLKCINDSNLDDSKLINVTVEGSSGTFNEVYSI